MTVVAGAGRVLDGLSDERCSSSARGSDVNFTTGADGAELCLAPSTVRSTDLFNSSASPVNIVIDAFGFFAPPPPSVIVTANPTSLPADGMSTSALTVTVNTGSGVAFDDLVTFTTTPSVTGPSSCGRRRPRAVRTPRAKSQAPTRRQLPRERAPLRRPRPTMARRAPWSSPRRRTTAAYWFSPAAP